MYASRIRAVLDSLWPLLLVFVSFFMVARLLMLQDSYAAGNLAGYKTDFTRMWLTGLRYDMRIAAMALLPALLLALPMAVHHRSWGWWQVLARFHVLLVGFLLLAAMTANYFYYETFHRPFDIFMFGLFEDDTKSVLHNIWDDYPLVPMVLFVVLGSVACAWIFSRLLQHRQRLARPFLKFFIIYLLGSVLVMSLMARGSLGTFPLRRSNAQVSPSAVLNHLTPNAVMAFSWAWKDRQDDIAFVPVSSLEGEELLQQLGLDSIYARTPENAYLQEHPPHVVVSLMESFGSNMLAFDEAGQNDLLGALRQHFAEDFLFTRFLPHGNGTAPSLAGLFFHSPMQNISHSSASRVALDTPFATYKKAGYETVFISPGNLMWRNLANYLPLQGVDRVHDQNTLLQEFPEAAQYMTDWGLPDEYAYRYAEKLLETAERPLFISLLTVTNHPPYQVPSSYQSYPVSLATGYATHAEEGRIDHENLLRTFQYAANALGEFISHIKQSALADRTLIAATGDHHMRRIKAYHPREGVLDLAVPFYLYVPDAIRQHSPIHFDPLRVGSHKDIMPTLYGLSIPGHDYLALGGRNLLAANDSPGREFAYNELAWMERQGVISLQEPWSWNAWLNATDGLWLDARHEHPGMLQSERIRAYVKLLKWNLNRQVKGLTGNERSTLGSHQ